MGCIFLLLLQLLRSLLFVFCDLLQILQCDSMVGTFLTRAGWKFSMEAFGEQLAPRNGTKKMLWFSVVNLVSPKPMEHTIKSPRANELFGSLISNAKEVR